MRRRKDATALCRELGAELQRCRKAAGLSGPELAERADWDHSKISRMETGHIAPSDVDVVQYLIYCGLTLGEVTDIIKLCRVAENDIQGYWLSPHEPSLPDSALSLMYHESTAQASIAYEPHVVPGLLQTENYIRTLTTERWPRSDIDLAVRTRLDRQRVLSRADPARFEFFVHENALRLMVGDPATMHEQLLALMLLDSVPNLRIRVVPASAGFGGAFRLFQFAKHNPLVYLDAYIGGLFLEDEDYVLGYRHLVQAIASVALNEGQSREFVASLANEYDRGSPGTRVEEEQL